MAASRESGDLGHHHVFLGASHDENARRTLWVVALTSVTMVVEIVAGYAFNSMALLADGFHMATHAGALAISAGAYAFARKHAASRRFSFGTGKVGDLAGFASALVLGIVALAIAVESADRLIAPHVVAFDQAIIVAVVGLVVNLASAALLGGGHHHAHHGADDHHGHHHGHAHGHPHDHDHAHGHPHGHGHDDHAHGHPARDQDHNLRSAYLHVLADALTSVLAIVALVLGRSFGWVWLDPAMGIVGAVIIARWSWMLLRDAAGVLLDATDDRLESEVRDIIGAQEEDAQIVDLHVWRVGPGAYAAIVSLTGFSDGAAVRRRLESVHELAHVTVELR